MFRKNYTQVTRLRPFEKSKIPIKRSSKQTIKANPAFTTINISLTTNIDFRPVLPSGDAWKIYGAQKIRKKWESR